MVSASRCSSRNNPVPTMRTRSATRAQLLLPVCLDTTSDRNSMPRGVYNLRSCRVSGVQGESIQGGQRGSGTPDSDVPTQTTGMTESIPEEISERTPAAEICKTVKIGRTEYNLQEEVWTNQKMWEEAREFHRKHRHEMNISIPSKSQIKLIAKKCMDKINEDLMKMLLEENKMSRKAAIKHIETVKNQGPNENMKNKIQRAIKTGVQLSLLSPQKKRFKLTSKCGKFFMYLNENQLNAKIHHHSNFTLTEKNILKITCGSKRKTAADVAAAEDNSKLCCSCTGNACDPKTCQCHVVENVFRMPFQKDNLFRRRYRCTEECACRGACGIQDPSGGTEVLFHHQVQKGFAMRATTFHGLGTTVAEMTGEVEDNLDGADSYAFDAYYGRNANIEKKDADVQNDRKKKANGCTQTAEDKYFFQQMISLKEMRIPYTEKKEHKKLLNDFHDVVLRWGPSYRTKAERLFATNWSINPTHVGNSGRFISSSCFPNARPTVVYSKGLNPLNIRVFFTALMPIFPNMEISFHYSPDYVKTQLKNKCCCGSLACIRNRKMWPYIKEEHIIQFYTDLYAKSWAEYKKEVIEKL